MNRRLQCVWYDMKRRCLNKTHSGYKNYGGRGISICNEWKTSKKEFLKWALINGYGDDLVIDRKNNDGDYTPLNCRFVTKADSNRNNRRNKKITAFGETKLLWHWFKDKRCKVNFRTVYQRLSKGYDYHESLFTPPARANFH